MDADTWLKIKKEERAKQVEKFNINGKATKLVLDDAKFLESVREQVVKGKLTTKNMDSVFKRSLEKEIEKENKDSASVKPNDAPDIRECFGPPDSCTNCESKGDAEKTPKSGLGALKRCSGCHLAVYCSEMCQKEHWINNHKRMCKILSGKKKIETQTHSLESCKTCNSKIDFILKEKNSYNTPCGLDTIQIYLVNHYWLQFGYHNEAVCKCSPEKKRLIMMTMQFPMKTPFTMGELSGEYLGWIDQYLSVLAGYIVSIEEKYEKEIESLGIKSRLNEIAMFIAGNRASYWYFVTNEKSRAMSEVLFTQRFHSISTNLRGAENDWNHLQEIDKAFSTLEEKNVWWETFLHHLAQFYRRVRRTRYRLFNTETIPKHKKKEFVLLEELQERAIMELSSSVEKLLPTKLWTNIQGLDPGFLVVLSPGTKCQVCEVDIGGKSAQWQLQVPVFQYIWSTTKTDKIEEKMLIRYPNLPIIFEGEYKEGILATCGVKENCNLMATKNQLETYLKVTKANLNFVFKSQKCQGCLKYALESHRCSGCRSVRYCSQDCLVDDWKVHQSYCIKSTETGTIENNTEGIIGSRKLDGEAKTTHFDDSINWLGKCDTIVRLMLFTWKLKGVDFVDELFYPDSSKEKKKKKGKSKYKENTEIPAITEEKLKEPEEITPRKQEYEAEEEKEAGRSGVTMLHMTKEMKQQLTNLIENSRVGVGLSVLSMDESNNYCIKPIVTEDKDGKPTVHMENIPNKSCKHVNHAANAQDTFNNLSLKGLRNTGENEQKQYFVKPENLEKIKTIVEQHRSNTLIQKKFEIRHIKNQTSLNKKTCQVVNVELKAENLFDPRVVCKLSAEDKQISLKQTNLVDIGANIDNIIGTKCIEGHRFRESGKSLTNTFVTKKLSKLVSWAEETRHTRPDQVYRLAELRKYLAGEVKEIRCKDIPEYEKFGLNDKEWHMAENELFSACLASIRPGCIGDSFVHFHQFNQLICGCEEQLDRRFREFVVTGMCHSCQVRQPAPIAYYLQAYSFRLTTLSAKVQTTQNLLETFL